MPIDGIGGFLMALIERLLSFAYPDTLTVPFREAFDLKCFPSRKGLGNFAG
jgi:hypothetical protein